MLFFQAKSDPREASDTSVNFSFPPTQTEHLTKKKENRYAKLSDAPDKNFIFAKGF
jgi:hypothetical protein